MTSINDLVDAAKKENWGEVDAIIPEVCNETSFIKWALKTGLQDSDGNIRDLAASLLEKTKSLTTRMKEKLYRVMKNDPHPYAKFRAACAIAAHDTKYHAKEVREVLEIARKENDLSKIADSYVKKYRN